MTATYSVVLKESIAHYFVYNEDNELLEQGEPFLTLDDAIDCAELYGGEYIIECWYDFVDDDGVREYHSETTVWENYCRCAA
jgi:hypothetical protein